MARVRACDGDDSISYCNVLHANMAEELNRRLSMLVTDQVATTTSPEAVQVCNSEKVGVLRSGLAGALLRVCTIIIFLQMHPTTIVYQNFEWSNI